MEKTVFSEREKLFLVQLVSDKSRILENKKTDGNNLKLKNEAWLRITNTFNSQGFSFRSAKQLKKCWENIKQRKKTLNTSIRQDQLRTGGGLPKFKGDVPVMDFVDAAAPNLDLEVECPWDCTAVYEGNQAGNSTFREDSNVEKCPSDEIIIIEGETTSNSREKKRKIEEEIDLRIFQMKKEIENQKEIHAIRKKTAEMEYKLAVLKVKEQMKVMDARFNIRTDVDTSNIIDLDFS